VGVELEGSGQGKVGEGGVRTEAIAGRGRAVMAGEGHMKRRRQGTMIRDAR